MNMHKLRCVSPVDGRYARQTGVLADYFSEHALQKYRTVVEVEYLKALSRETIVRPFSEEEMGILDRLKGLPLCDAQLVKDIETVNFGEIKATNHDVKSVEYFMRNRLKNTSLSDVSEFIHFALTSEDVTNLAYALMIRDSFANVFVHSLDGLVESLYNFADVNSEVPMLARTHGQPASPTTFGKEMAVFASRLEGQVDELKHQKISAKLNGATGNFNAHVVAYPHIDWVRFSKEFIDSFNRGYAMKLRPNLITTQIEPHDSYCRIFDNMRRINSVLLDFSQDMWRYISDGWLKLKPKEGEVGSSTMPHKVNPIDFENAEGNIGLANALFTFFSQKLPVSRLQRDLSDSTVLRNVGVAFAHSLIAYNSVKKGLSKVALDENRILTDLNSHPEVLAEAIQVMLKSQGVKDAYETMKSLTRGAQVSLDSLHSMVDKLEVNDPTKKFLKSIRPYTYIGLASSLISS